MWTLRKERRTAIPQTPQKTWTSSRGLSLKVSYFCSKTTGSGLTASALAMVLKVFLICSLALLKVSLTNFGWDDSLDGAPHIVDSDEMLALEMSEGD